MIKVLKVTHDGRIEFSTDTDVRDIKMFVRDTRLNQVVFDTSSDLFCPGVNYFISINSAIIPSLRDLELVVTTPDWTQVIPISFPKNGLGNFSLIANSCLAWRTYETFNSEYNSPTIGCLILDDEEYLRFCEHNSTYVNAEMKFGESKGNQKWKENCGSVRVPLSEHVTSTYPISHHLDIEIHWIHDRPRKLVFTDSSYKFLIEDSKISNETFKDKWERRSERMQGTDKIFLWSASELFNIHGDWKRREIIDRFKSLPDRSIFLTEREDEAYEDDLHVVHFVPEWRGRHQLERNSGGGTLWNDQQKEASIIKDIIKRKFF